MVAIAPKALFAKATTAFIQPSNVSKGNILFSAESWNLGKSGII